MTKLCFLVLVSFLAWIQESYCQEVVTSVETKPTWNCDELDKNHVNHLAEQVLFHEADEKWPENKEELIKYCKRQSATITALDDYNEKCLKGRPKQIISMVTYQTRSWNTLYCRNPVSKHSKKLFTSAPCANEASNGYRDCNSAYVRALRRVYNSTVSHDAHIAQMCCGYLKVFECMREVASPLASCTEASIEYNEKYIRNLFDNVVSIICSEYAEESGKCDKILKKKKAKAMGSSAGAQVANSGTPAGTSLGETEKQQSFFGLVVDILTKE